MPLPAVGERVRGQSARVGGVRLEEAGGRRSEPEAYAGGSGGLLGPRHPAYQHAFPKGMYACIEVFVCGESGWGEGGQA